MLKHVDPVGADGATVPSSQNVAVTGEAACSSFGQPGIWQQPAEYRALHVTSDQTQTQDMEMSCKTGWGRDCGELVCRPALLM